MRIGFHIPFSGSLNKLKERIVASRGNTFQIYTRSKRGVDREGNLHKIKKLNKKGLREFHETLEKRNIKPVILHAPYSINLTEEMQKNRQGEEINLIEVVKEDLLFCKEIGAKYYVLQPGYYKKQHPILALQNVKESLTKILEESEWDGEILIKNMAGAGSELCGNLREWNEIISFHEKVKGTLDFSNAFKAGYEFRDEKSTQLFIDEVEEIVGWEKIKVLYINDTNKALGVKKGEKNLPPLGEGSIGFRGYESILSKKVIREKIWMVENQPTLEHVDRTISYLVSFFEKKEGER